jgi:hypothetical protein
MPIKTCLGCGQEFDFPTKRRSYCNGPCYRANERANSLLRSKTFSAERRQAYILVSTAKLRGDLVRQPCEVCGKDNRWDVVAHHDDYAAPLNVRWLCRSHHKQHHNKFGPGKNAFADQSSAS